MGLHRIRRDAIRNIPVLASDFSIAAGVNWVFTSSKAHSGSVTMIAFSDAFQSCLILLREGLEALLVIAALAAFLHRAGAADKVKSVYGGAVIAVLASFGAAYVFETYFSGQHNDFMEAAVMVI